MIKPGKKGRAVKPRRLKAVVQWIVRLRTTRDTQCLCFMVRTTKGSKTILIKWVKLWTTAPKMDKLSNNYVYHLLSLVVCCHTLFAVTHCLLSHVVCCQRCSLSWTFAVFVSFSGSTIQSSSDQNPTVIKSLVVIFLPRLLRFNLFSVKHNSAIIDTGYQNPMWGASSSLCSL